MLGLMQQAANNSKAKLNYQSKSEKESRGKKLVCSQTSTVMKDESRSYRENSTQLFLGKSSASKVQGSCPAQKNDDHISKALENHSTGNNSKDDNIIDLSSNEEDALPSQQVIGDVSISEWYCVMPKTGLTIGPFCMTLLKEWKDTKSSLHVVTDVNSREFQRIARDSLHDQHGDILVCPLETPLMFAINK
ncbi:hypothetical protein ACFE04_005911 [Oxalis oulophora]